MANIGNACSLKIIEVIDPSNPKKISILYAGDAYAVSMI